MPNSKIDEIIEIIAKELETTKAKNNHLTLTLNDIYDTFNDLGLKIDRCDENTDSIIKMLKNKDYLQIDSFIFALIRHHKATRKAES